MSWFSSAPSGANWKTGGCHGLRDAQRGVAPPVATIRRPRWGLFAGTLRGYGAWRTDRSSTDIPAEPVMSVAQQAVHHDATGHLSGDESRPRPDGIACTTSASEQSDRFIQTFNDFRLRFSKAIFVRAVIAGLS
jgi:hypothetical protein